MTLSEEYLHLKLTVSTQHASFVFLPLGVFDDCGGVGGEEVLDGVTGVGGRDLGGRSGVGVHPEGGGLLPLGQRGTVQGVLLLVRGITEKRKGSSVRIYLKQCISKK